jgi:hypothetical protein
MVNYNNGKIYKIECLTTGLIYIGSTTKQYLSQRIVEHRSNYKRYQDGNCHYLTSFKVLENDNYLIELLESVDCNSKDELVARERFHYDNIKNCNSQRPIKLELDKKDDNMKRYQRQLELHPDHNKTYYQRQLKLHPNLQKDKYQKELKKNPNFNEDRKQTKYICDCGKSVGRIDLKSRHEKTKKHINYLSSLENINPQI